MRISIFLNKHINIFGTKYEIGLVLIYLFRTPLNMGVASVECCVSGNFFKVLNYLIFLLLYLFFRHIYFKFIYFVCLFINSIIRVIQKFL